MKILILGHYEIASNYSISMVVNELLEHDIKIMLSGKGDVFENDGNEFSQLAKFEQNLCDDLNRNIDSLGLNCDSFDSLAEKTGKTIDLLASPNTHAGIEQIQVNQPDLIISIRYRKILKEQVIAIPKFGIINLHSGLLPEYRGAMATFWAMLNGEQTIGSTLHYITDGTIDTGDIITRSIIVCDYSKTYLDNVLALYPQGSKNIVKAVQNLSLGKEINSSSQPNSGVYYSFPTEENRQLFLSLGHSLFQSD